MVTLVITTSICIFCFAFLFGLIIGCVLKSGDSIRLEYPYTFGITATVLFISSSIVAFGMSIRTFGEIKEDQYRIVNGLCEAHPQIKPLVLELTKDGKITNCEFEEIKYAIENENLKEIKSAIQRKN